MTKTAGSGYFFNFIAGDPPPLADDTNSAGAINLASAMSSFGAGSAMGTSSIPAMQGMDQASYLTHPA